MLSAISQDTPAALNQVTEAAKTKEITQFATLPEHATDFKGKVTTAYALHAQKGYARYLPEHEAHFIFSVKGN